MYINKSSLIQPEVVKHNIRQSLIHSPSLVDYIDIEYYTYNSWNTIYTKRMIIHFKIFQKRTHFVFYTTKYKNILKDADLSVWQCILSKLTLRMKNYMDKPSRWAPRHKGGHWSYFFTDVFKVRLGLPFVNRSQLENIKALFLGSYPKFMVLKKINFTTCENCRL